MTIDEFNELPKEEQAKYFEMFWDKLIEKLTEYQNLPPEIEREFTENSKKCEIFIYRP